MAATEEILYHQIMRPVMQEPLLAVVVVGPEIPTEMDTVIMVAPEAPVV